jgi:nucleotide-binding universal stress UspA family protein
MDCIETKRIVCPVDYSEFSESGLAYGLHMAKVFDAELLLLHVVEIPYVPSYGLAGEADLSVPIEKLESSARDEMESLVKRSKERHANTQGEVLTGTPFLEIINYARECAADLIVMGTHGRTGLSHMLIGSVAEKVVRKAPCPVLTVKHPDHAFEMP